MSSIQEHLPDMSSAVGPTEAFEVAAAIRRNRLIALWAAAKMGLNNESSENYARAVEGFYTAEEDVIRKISGDLLASNIVVRESEVRTRAAEFLAQAREALKAG